MKIVKYKKDKTGKYQIILEDGSIIKSYEDVIINNNLLYKKNLDSNTISKIEQDNNEELIYNKCLKYLTIRVRSKQEMLKYLDKLTNDTPLKNNIINKLTNNKYIDDYTFTELYIKDKQKLTNWGKYKIINNLKDKGIIDSIINEYDYLFNKEEERIINIINKYKKTKTGDIRNKLYNNLINTGYSVDLVIKCLNNNLSKN